MPPIGGVGIQHRPRRRSRPAPQPTRTQLNSSRAVARSYGSQGRAVERIANRQRRRATAPIRRARTQERSYRSQGRAVEHAAKQQRRASAVHPPSSAVKRRQAHAQERSYRSQGRAVRRAARQQRLIKLLVDQQTRRRALGIPAAHHDVGISTTPAGERYKRSDAYFTAKERAAQAAYKNASPREKERLFGSQRGSSNPSIRRRQLRAAGLGLTGDYWTTVYKDALNNVVNAPTSLYLTTRAAVKAAGGNPKEFKAIAKSFKEHDPVGLAVQGKFKRALQEAKQRPVTTALELSGGKAVLGRAGGAAGRAGLLGDVGRRAARTDRPSLRLYSEAETRGRTLGPAVEQKYSRDVINKALQVANERRIRKGSRVRRTNVFGPKGTQRRPGRDPFVDRGSRLVPARLDSGHGPVRQRLKRRVDTRVAVQSRILEEAKRKAAAEAKKGYKKPDVRRLLELAARADMIRTELRARLRHASAAEKRAIRAQLKLDDHQLIRAVETGARSRMSARDEVLAGLTDEQKVTAARSLDRRARRGKSLTPRQAEAVQAAVGKQITRDVGARKAVPEHPATNLLRAVVAGHKGEVPERRAVERPAAPRRVPKGPNPHTLQAAANSLGIRNPIVVRALSRRAREGRRAGYGGLQVDRATGKHFHVIYFNPEHGLGARNAALWHELQHAADVEKGRAFSPTTGEQAAGYASRASEQAANEAMAANMDVNLFEGPEQFRQPPRISPLSAEDFSGYLSGIKARRSVAPKRIEPTAADEFLANLRPNRDVTIASHIGRSIQDVTEQNQRLLADEFGIPLGKRGTVRSKNRAAKIIGRKQKGAEADLVPFRRSDGEWVAVPRVVEERFRQHAAVDTSVFGPGSGLDRASGVFKDVVLTSASPARWLGGNVGDLGMRTLLEGITPLDIARGVGAARRMRRQGLRGEQVAHNLTGGGLYGTADDLSSMSTIGKLNVPRHIWRGWKRAIYTLEHSMEKLPQYGAVGKDLRRTTGRVALADVRKARPEQFERAVKNSGAREGYLTPYSANEYKAMKTFLAPDGKSGFAIRGDELVNLFARSDARVRGTDLLAEAQRRGARRLDATSEPGKGLEKFYSERGWTVDRVEPWDERYGTPPTPNSRVVYMHAPEDGQMKVSLKSLLKLTDHQMTHYAENAVRDRAAEARIQKQVEDVIGRWGKVSPAMRRTLSIAPFAQWLGAATRYVLVTLPVHHPIKTGIMAGINSMTEDERRKLGLSYFAPVEDRAPDYQMGLLPLNIGRNKYGPTVSGIRTSRMFSLGTAGSIPTGVPEFLLPQISGAVNALQGRDYTGQPLVYPDWYPKDKAGLAMDMADRIPVAAGAQLEPMIPFASAFRSAILEQGRPADPSSTILTPMPRKKFDYEHKRYVDYPASPLSGVLKWAGPYAGPPFSPASRIYTLGASRDIQRSQETMQTLDKWNKRRKRESQANKTRNWFAPAPSPTPTPTPSPAGSWFK